jgi:tetratricopeptide (TPR) repeat protein
MAHTARPLRRIVLVAGVLGGLFASTSMIASHHRAVLDRLTEQHLDRGDALTTSSELQSAAREYRAALSLDRGNDRAARSLALTLLSLGRLAESESYLRDLLRRAPTDGALNRDLARIEAATNRPRDARASYQRAVYGEWPVEDGAARTETRFELVDYLAQTGSRDEVLAELLRLTAELPAGQTAASRRAADLLVAHGAPALAADALRGALRTAPADPNLLAHLAEIETSIGQLAAARIALRRAVTVAPARSDLTHRLDVVERILAIDPTLPGLTLVTRTRRARTLLTAVSDQTRQCSAPDTADAVLRVAMAQRLRARARTDAAAAEEELALAARVWIASPRCHGAGVEAHVLAQVLDRVGRQLGLTP